ncbi:MAG: acyltransferase [Hyphomicrobiaceae bacterium]
MHWIYGRRLGDTLIDPTNGFGMLRLIAALSVVFSHSFYLRTHLTASEPLFTATGFTLGQHAVHVFFVVSGLLVTASLVRTPTLTGYLSARVLRIFPALAVCTILTAFVLGPAVTSLPITAYLTSSEPVLYVLKTVGLATGHAPLPGVFDTNPVAGEINIPVWTLKYELICYLALAGLAVAGVFRSWAATTFVVGVIVVAYVVPHLAGPNAAAGPASALGSLSRLGLCFTAGMLAFILRNSLRIGLLAPAVAALAYVLARGTGLESTALIVLTTFLSLAVASIPFGRLADWTRETDISYGTYIYGWPVMQLMLFLFPGIGQLQLFALTLALLIPAAYLSWRFVEKPALSLKRRPQRPQTSALRQKITAPRPPIAPEAVERLDENGEPLPPPPSRRRIQAALRTSPQGRLRLARS